MSHSSVIKVTLQAYVAITYSFFFFHCPHIGAKPAAIPLLNLTSVVYVQTAVKVKEWSQFGPSTTVGEQRPSVFVV